MKKTVIGALVVLPLLIIAIAVFCNRKQEDAGVIQDGGTDNKVAETEGTLSEPESEIVLSVANDEEGENKEDKTEGKEEKKTDMPEIPAKSFEESAKSNPSETVEMTSAVVQESTGPVSTEEQKAAGTDTNSETSLENKENGSSEESSSENHSGIDCSEFGIYGDTGKKMYYPCDKECYSAVVGDVCNPKIYKLPFADVYHDEVLALSERFKKEHPFSAGSILKPYYPDIDEIYWFTGNFDERYVVLKAYDTSNVKKYFLIEFTITDNYELDTVSIRELADDEVGE